MFTNTFSDIHVQKYISRNNIPKNLIKMFNNITTDVTDDITEKGGEVEKYNYVGQFLGVLKSEIQP